MKANRIIMLATIAMMSIAAMAQDVMYFLPKTEVTIELTYTETVLTMGPYYQYAERFLGTKDVITEQGKEYAIQDIRVSTKNTPDTSNPYFLTPNKNGVLSFCMSKEGLLQGVNVAIEKEAVSKLNEHSAARSKTEVAYVMPLLEEQMLAGSTNKVAEGVAKQIYRIREARLNLLSGDVEQVPADGKSMEMMLKELRKQEQELTALFVGKKEVKQCHKTITIAFDQLQDGALAFRFSKYDGLVENDDMSGKPYYIHTSDEYRPTEPIVAKPLANSGIQYVVPGTIKVSVNDGENTLAERNITIAQLGYVTYLSVDAMKRAPKVVLGKAGQLLSIE